MIITDKAQIKAASLKESDKLRLMTSDELECYELIESDLKLPADAIFTRSSVAYLTDGTQAPANTPRFEQGRFGKAIMVEEGTTNLLTANQSSVETDTTGFSAYVSTISRITTHAWQGVASLQVNTNSDAAYGGVALTFTAAANTTYTVSFYYRTDSPLPMRGTVKDADGVYHDFPAMPDANATWQRFAYTFTTGATAGTATIYIQQRDTGPATFYVDGLQVEQKSFATSWTLSGSTCSPESLTIPTAGVLNPQEGTVECWVYVNSTVRRGIAGNWSTVVLIRKGTSIANWIWLHHNPANTWVLQIRKEDDAVTGQGDFSDSLTPDGWHYFTIRWNAQAGTADLFHNGVKRVSLTGVAFPAEYDRIDVGYRSGGSGDWLNSLIDDLCISSRARTDEEIAVAYQSGKPLSVDEWTTYKLDFNDKVRITTQGQIICNELIEI